MKSIFFLFFLFSAIPMFSINIQDLSTGLDGQINCFIEFNGKIFAGGSFEIKGQPGKGIASWDGKKWKCVGEGISDGNIQCLVVHDGQLYAGGKFTMKSNTEKISVAKWDGTKWQTVGTYLNNSVWAMCVFKNELFIAGMFSKSGNTKINYIAKLSGDQWVEIGGGMNKNIFCLSVYQDQLYAGGSFTQAGKNAIQFFAKWDGSNWSGCEKGVDGMVNSVAVYKNDLYVCGYFTHAGDTTATCIASWNGKSWSSMEGLDIDNYITNMAVAFDKLIIIGKFSHLSKMQKVDGVAQFNGQKWKGIAVGSFHEIYSIYGLNNKLFLGGAQKQKDLLYKSRVLKITEI